jgi:hypothetical protein
MTATYFNHGHGKSLNARAAERSGIYPATKTARVLGISTALLKEIASPCEWHHVGKFASRCDYYSTDAANFDLDQCLTALRSLRSRLTAKRKLAKSLWMTYALDAMKRERADAASRQLPQAKYSCYLPFNAKTHSIPSVMREARVKRRVTALLDVAHKTAYAHASGSTADRVRFVSDSLRARINSGELGDHMIKLIQSETICMVTAARPTQPMYR